MMWRCFNFKALRIVHFKMQAHIGTHVTKERFYFKFPKWNANVSYLHSLILITMPSIYCSLSVIELLFVQLNLLVLTISSATEWNTHIKSTWQKSLFSFRLSLFYSQSIPSVYRISLLEKPGKGQIGEMFLMKVSWHPTCKSSLPTQVTFYFYFIKLKLVFIRRGSMHTFFFLYIFSFYQSLLPGTIVTMHV